MEIRRTAGGVVVGPGEKVVVVNQHGDSWSLPKGGIDPGETALQAAVREIREESGLTELKPICELGSYRRPRIGKNGQGESENEEKDITLFLFTTREKKLQPEDPDNPEAIWLPMGKVASRLTHLKDREFLESKIPFIKQVLGEL